ncbi:MAG: calcium/sodium antiporter [Gammaproteobacteria bacterium]|jgi:cation:H+ antiporter|nr:calcium/sodium antiporter [Gammaproteobacteria bacterium]
MLLDLISVAIGLALLIWGADRFVVGAAGTARNLGVPTLLIGLTIVGFATSAPEILVSVVAAIAGRPSLALGNAIGSNIANVALVLGAVAAVRPILVTSTILRREMPLLLAVTLLTLALFLDLRLTRIDGFVLIGVLFVVLYWIVRLGLGSRATDPIEAEYEAEIPRDMPMRTAVLWLAVGLAVLLVGSELLVDGAIQLARELGVSELVVGVTLVAIGTSLPELAVSLMSALKGEQGLAIGNILGSNMFNLLAVIGLAVAIHPATVEPVVLTLHFFVMVAVTLVLFAMTYNYADAGRIGRLEGVALLVAFVAYHAYVVSQNLGQAVT